MSAEDANHIDKLETSRHNNRTASPTPERGAVDEKAEGDEPDDNDGNDQHLQQQPFPQQSSRQPQPQNQWDQQHHQHQQDQQHSTDNSQSTASLFSYFTHPLQYTVEGVLRRLSADEPPTALARALSANYNGSMIDPSAANTSFPRRSSPFQPPPLTPLTLTGYKDTTPHKTRLLSKPLAEEVRLLVPPRLQLVDAWSLTYSLEQDGSTLSTLYNRCERHRGKRGGFVVVVRDSSKGTFGAYLSDSPKPGPHYYGSGECFLWRAFRLPALPDLSSLPPPPSADTTHLGRMTTLAPSRSSSSSSLAPLANGRADDGNKSKKKHDGTSTPERIRFKAFPFSGENDYSIFCQPEYFSVGGGDGHYGLWLDTNLSSGVSETCPTFGNEPLSEEGTKFDVLGVEVWYVGI